VFATRTLPAAWATAPLRRPRGERDDPDVVERGGGGGLQLFDDYQRTHAAAASHAEASFSFLNRASGPVWERIRFVLSGWYAAFPDADGDLRNRFRSTRPGQHYGAWWELYLHHVFCCLGFEIEIHRELSDARGRPDFLLRRGSDAFYLEAKTVFSGIVEDGRHEPREAQVMDAIDAIECRDFSVSLDFDEVGQQSPSRQAITRPVAEWLRGLDHPAVSAQIEAGGNPPEKSFRVGDWRFTLAAFPLLKPAEAGHRLIGVGPASVGGVNDIDNLRAALRQKRKSYGMRELPLVIAVLAKSSFMHDTDVEQALFGTHAYAILGDRQLAPTRNPDGFWQGRGGASATRVSAVLLGRSIHPHNCARVWPRLWHHPWALRSLDAKLPFPTARVVADKLTLTDAEDPPAPMLDLPTDWPEVHRPGGDDTPPLFEA
jgi:hypothetical protein